MFGVQTTSDGLQKFAANRLRRILLSLTKRTFLAVLFGIVMTVAFQSSAATTVLVVEFVNAGLMTLGQALGIVLGSAVGTSIAIQLLAFKMLPIALGLIFIGFILLWVRVKQWKHLGQALIGFGMVFVGMSHMSGASAPLKNIPEVYTFLAQLAAQPVLAIIVGLLLTTVIQSSTAVFAIMMSLAGQRLLPLGAVVPLVLGVHIGGTVMALLSSLTAQKTDAKRAAIANTGYKVVGTILVLPFLGQFVWLVQWTTADLQRQVANAHLVFALFMVIIFFPFNSLIAKTLTRLLPDRQVGGNRSFRYLDASSIEVPAIALTQAFQEIKGLGRFIYESMMRPLPEALLAERDTLALEIARVEKDVDWYHHHISRFLVGLSKRGLTDEQTEENINAQFILKELEYIGDDINSMVTIILKVHRQDLTLPQAEWEGLKEIYVKTAANFARVLEALESWDAGVAAEVIREHPEILRVQRSLQFNALAESPRGDLGGDDIRDEEKLRYAKVDLINLFYGVDEHVVNIAQVVMGIA
ncbi:Na/Pi cotransporter family protein [Paradesulfitobacterium aromaticivorans]